MRAIISDVLNDIRSDTGIIVFISVIFITFQVILSTVRSRFGASEFSSYRVALVGPPGSGKTTGALLILNEIVTSPLAGNIRLRGQSTISFLEAGSDCLNKQTFLPRTQVDETNVYRFDYVPIRSVSSAILSVLLPSPRAYRVEIGDFAGELAERFYDSNTFAPSTRFSFSDDTPSNFLKWISESDKCLLFVDLSEYVRDPVAYSAYITTKYIAFWQRYLDLHADKLSPKVGTPVILVFSKADVLASVDEDGVGFRENMQEHFRNLYQYLSLNARSMDLAIMSAIDRREDGQPKGVDDLVKLLLPRGLNLRDVLRDRRGRSKATSSDLKGEADSDAFRTFTGGN